ncbi:uncharacterized protein LOC121416064 [Lytechinus variegatus]|uniref:uncharacterized protein LOC121416064 n=1 Tax=Lytechinus variegatus TaxID=7654 RepID=UPI001BB28519|nr:uncharacterized protein LOC121416064 [Lytechinus variegatus]
MATGQPYRVRYPNSQIGQQIYDTRTHSFATTRGHHPPNLTHSVTSAFRPAGIPQVPLQQRLVSPGVIPSNQEQYHQQQTVPSGGSGKHAMQLSQHQNQQHFFQNLPSSTPANRFQEISVDAYQRESPNSAVQSVAQVQYPHLMRRYHSIKETDDSEALHQELRMLHAVHYQDVNRKDELVDTYWKQKIVLDNKQLAQVSGAHQTRYGPQIISNGTVLRKRVLEDTRAHGQQAQAMYLPRQGELYQERKNELPLDSVISPSHPLMARYPHAQSETRVKIDRTMQSHVPHLVQSIRHGVSSPNSSAGIPRNYQRYHYKERYNVPQQFETRSQGVMMPHQSVQPVHQELFQNQRLHRNLPPQIHTTNMMNSEVRLKQETQPNVSVQYSRNVGMMPNSIEQMTVKAQMRQVNQLQTMGNMMAGHMHNSNLSGQIMRNRICEDVDKKISTDDISNENRRLSKMAVSIKEEQRQLKEVLEKSLHRAAVQSTQKTSLESLRNSSSYMIANPPCGNESMPRIVKVQSLAEQESNGAATRAQSNATIGISVGIPRGDGLGVNLKPSKPKSAMIKAHQELQEVPSNVNRVPSIGSLDSDSGRKDSWDSGIESPPWPENREACVMNMKRAASCDEKASQSNLHQIQRAKVIERKSSHNSLLNTGLDLSAQDLTNIPTERKYSVPNPTTSNVDVLCNSSFKTLNGNAQLVVDEEEKKNIPGGPVRWMNRKRSLPTDSVCPVVPKVMNQNPQAVAFSKCMRACVPVEEARKSFKGQTVKTMIVQDECPLDLSLKKDQDETCSEITEVQSNENEVTIEQKPNIDNPEEETEINSNKLKKEEAFDGEGNKGPDGQESGIPGPENQMQGYFGTIMMRALQRLWSETITKLDGEEASKTKLESIDSSDEDSGKYFQPSSVTTLKNIPQVDSPVGSVHALGHELMKNMPSGCSSPHALEVALCELMQQSSGAFRHGGDIFQHFDSIIKRELMIEIEKQPLKCKDESITETKQEEDSSLTESDLNEMKPDEQASETSVLGDGNSSIMLDREEEVDDSQNLVIVESSMSPKSLPDTHATEDKMEHTPAPAPILKSFGSPTPVTVESPVRESFMSPGQMYAKAAREAAQKAAKEAANKAAKEAAHKAANEAAKVAAQKAAQKVLPVTEDGVSQVQSGCRSGGDANGIDIISSERSSLRKTPPGPSGPLKPNSSLYHNAQGDQRYSLQLQNIQRSAAVFVNQPQAPAHQRPQFMGQDIPTVVDGEEAARDTCSRPHALVERRSSESAIFKQNGTNLSKKDKLQRMTSDDSLINNSLKNYRTIAPSNKQITKGNSHHVMPQTVWQAQTQDDNANKVRLVKVAFNNTIPVQAPPSVSIVPNAQYIQKQLQRSPIVLLPKLVCVAGQTYSEVTPDSGTQTCSPGNIVPQKDNKESVNSTSPVLPTVSVQVPSNDSASVKSSNLPLVRPVAERVHSPELIDTVIGPFHIIQKPPVEQPSSKKPSVSAFIIIYKKISLPGILRSGVPFVPPRLLQIGIFPKETFEEFCHALQDCNIMQRYMTVLERSALFTDLKHNKISSCKLVSLEEFDQKYENIKVLMQISKMT